VQKIVDDAVCISSAEAKAVIEAELEKRESGSSPVQGSPITGRRTL
jgi:hypothetical protein